MIYDERYAMMHKGYNTYQNTTDICYKIVQFLLDIPYVESGGDFSEVSQTGCRADLIKYIFYDNANPLACKLPTLEEKKNLIFNPDKPQKPPIKEKGYRIFAQSKIIDVQTDSKIELRVYPSMITPVDAFMGDLIISFECWSNMDYQQLKSFQSRTYNMVVCILSALNGRNMAGIGTMFFDKKANAYCNVVSITDNRYNIGHRLTMGVSIADEHHG